MRAPGMQLDHPFLRQRHQVVRVARHQVGTRAVLLLDGDAVDRFDAMLEMLLEKTVARQPFGTAQQAEGAAGDSGNIHSETLS